MLIYDHEGLLEVDAQEIKQLCRSTAPVIFSDAESDAYEIHVVLCNYLDNLTQRCRVAFHAKNLKRTLVFADTGGGTRSLWQNGQEVLTQLGFQLEDVNLELSPAMLEVVLRDIPGVATPGGVRKQRLERTRLLAELQSTYDKEPDSAAGKKAANKLRDQKRLDDRTLELRQFLEELLGPAEAAAADLRTLLDQVQELTERVAAAEALGEAERSQREISESITAAAEKRIQELEVSLVEMDTISANALKQKRKIAQLQKRLKELSGALESAEQEAASELAKQQQSSADCKAAHDRIVELDAELQKSATSLENAQVQLAEEKVEKARLDECLKVAELRIDALDKELTGFREQAGCHDDVVKAAEDVRVQLADAQQALHEALGRNQELERDLAAAAEQGGSLASELTKIREEYDQEYNLRKHLEKSATQNEKRIRALKKSLVRAVEDAAERPAAGESSPETAAEAETLKAELQQQSARLNRERQSRKKLEAALHDAHEQIDSLAETIRQKEQAADRASTAEAALAVGNSKAMELEEQLRSVEEQLAREVATQSKLAKDLVEAEQQIAKLTTAGTQPNAERKERRVHESAADTEPAVEPRVKSSRPLPHELRLAPKKGALFHPDWDLSGLPCTSIKQINKAWESAFNVQISLEGYPSQYCMVYLVVLKLAEQKKLYLLCRLKKSKHTLVSVPANMPHDEVSLQKAIADGLKFLKMSGFEMEEISVENIESTLGSYCLKA